MLTHLQSSYGLSPAAVIADVGAGTGLLSELFVRNGNTVYAVEPNVGMLAKAEALLGSFPGFHGSAGRSEATGMPAASVDWITAGQAFHWFEPVATRTEFQRILRPGGRVALVWNSRREDGTPFLRAYQTVLEEFGTDYRQVNHKAVVDSVALTRFFVPGPWEKASFANYQVLSWEGLVGRVTSASFVPGPASPRYPAMLARLEEIFAACQQHGVVTMVYDTEVYVGRFD